MNLKNNFPVVFGFFGERINEVKLDSFEVIENISDDFDEQINDVKRRLVSGEKEFNLNKVYFCGVADASKDDCFKVLEHGKKIRLIFQQDFTTVSLSLIVLLSERHKKNNTTIFEFLNEISKPGLVYDQIFILSDKNEMGVVNEKNWINLCKSIAYIPQINNLPSHFCEIVTKKAEELDKQVFISAGFWQEENENQVKVLDSKSVEGFKKLASILEKKMSEKKINNTFTDESKINDFSHPANSTVAENIVSVAAKPLRFWELWGMDIKKSEKLLFENEAKNFFANNYINNEPNENKPEAIQLPLTKAVELETRLLNEKQNLEDIILDLKSDIKKEENKKPSPFSQLTKSIDDIKNDIGNIYEKKYELCLLEHEHKKISTKYLQINEYLNYIRGLVKELKNLKPETPPEKENNQKKSAPYAISLIRTDGLIEESFELCDDKNTFIRFIGGFTLENMHLKQYTNFI